MTVLNNGYNAPYEKLTTLSIFFSFLNRLVQVPPQTGLRDLTDDHLLPLVLAPPQHRLGTHELHDYLPNKRGGVFMKGHLLSKAFMWATGDKRAVWQTMKVLVWWEK